ncbi:uncharacterized protein LOC113352667 [Papaver somniferum]|uniref:uncharacterized protein LOC113352667 n=1 Tax=Papaver somniferum TaxID=3469 RepID=UPI000E6F7A63|nr:uncharacterized protein LOC113352667 [Papaver somniferum]
MDSNENIIQQPADRGDQVSKMVKDFITPSNSWDIEKLDEYFSPAIKEKILAISTQSEEKDKMKWRHHSSGDFSVKNIYNFLNNQDQEVDTMVDFPWKRLWKIKTIPRIKLFLWKLVQKALPTSSRLASHMDNISADCQMCNAQIQENEQHLFRFFPFARAIWFGVSLSFINNPPFPDSICNWVKNWIVDPNYAQISDKIATVLWFMWKYRCSVVFEGKDLNPTMLIEMINKYLHSAASISITKKTSARNGVVSTPNWSTINTKWIIFIDATFKKEYLSMGFSFILYSMDQEQFMHIEAGSDKAMTVVQAEAKAMLKATSWLRNNILSSVSIITYCKTIVDFINKKCEEISWEAENTIKEVGANLDNLPQAKELHGGNMSSRKFVKPSSDFSEP